MIEMEDGKTFFKDAILYPGGAEEWDWNKTGTNHKDGIQPDEINYLIKKGADVIILSTGQLGRLKISERARQIMEEKKIEYHILKSEEAAMKFNELHDSRKCGALIHSTC